MRTIFFTLAFLIIAFVIKGQNFERRNSLILETNLIATLSASYDRIIPFTEKLSLTLGGDYIMGVGFGHGAHWIAPEANLLFFGPKNYLETGVLYALNIKSGDEEEEEDSNSSPGFRVGYKILGKRGFTFRASANILFDIDPIVIPEVGIGYSF